MNIVLFEPSEIGARLPLADPRAQHVLKVLRRAVGDTFDAGVINGPRGKATVAAASENSLELAFDWTPSPAPLPSLTLLIGLPRPQTARDILRDATTLGATRIHFVTTERADPNYTSSSLWSSGEWRRHCVAGAAQAFDTRIPEVTWSHSLAAAITALSPEAERVALDNYEASESLAEHLRAHASSVSPLAGTALAFGPERGWGDTDRERLRAAGFTLAHLGTRVLRAETAIVAALAITQAR